MADILRRTKNCVSMLVKDRYEVVVAALLVSCCLPWYFLGLFTHFDGCTPALVTFDNFYEEYKEI